MNKIHFKTCTSAYNCLRDMARQIEAALGNAGNWRIAFEDGLRGFAARISTLTTSLQLLDKPFDVPPAESSPEQWAIDTDQRIAEIFFGMDSALECFVFALNAIGYLKSPSDFCDITRTKGLKRICPNNTASKNAHDKTNPRPGYGKYFPRVVACWSAQSVKSPRITTLANIAVALCIRHLEDLTRCRVIRKAPALFFMLRPRRSRT